ncbi:uncharacterized protein N7498_008137 [Penicillium cinerascens]|uniref:Protamine P1 n=1 Tax=Penicillium cinerascens TaxID=70096 RepID=A0A9W9JCU4_9EURO|nr:uncharacterized protein N7498_008137 [Penicillium cinerascens]KAJ5194699.1 hypothetical protein N7498_008137 [Penicillium cinerascens]
MPYPRPVSPVTFESCSPLASDIDSDDLLGSDDELEDSARAAKRQRIEKLAESYLRGQPLFILSASLRGPFDEGWRNPWTKKRKTVADTEPSGVRPDGHVREAEPVIQETASLRPKYREDLSVSRPSVDASLAETSTVVSVQGPKSSFVVGSAHKRPFQHAAADQENRAAPRSARKPQQASSMSLSTSDTTFTGDGPTKWLKKDRKSMNFARFEPPSSPTPEMTSRQSGDTSRTSVPRSVSGQASKPSALQTPKIFTVPEQPNMDTAAHISPRSAQTAVPATYQPSGVSKRSPHKEQTSPKKTGHAATSFHVVNSSSQLPRFEYRRWHLDSSSHAESKSPGRKPLESPQPAEAVNEQDEDTAMPDALEPANEPLADNGAKETDQSIRRSKDLRFVDIEASKSTVTYPQVPTEHNTYDTLPSAQEIPPPPGISDRMPSLHSTAMPKTDTEHNGDTSPDTQLSTQAALLHAQKSFQDDLESPEQEHGKTPAQPRPQSPSGDDSVLLAQETPIYRPNATEKFLLQGSRQIVRDRMQAMSTQCLIDAATPFAFSTEKKAQAHRPMSPQETSPREPEMAQLEASPLQSPDGSLPSPENAYETARSGPGTSSRHECERRTEQAPAHPPTTQGTALPFDLSGDTPATAQDGQGGDSFPLSQAIADLGSWLRQSSDFLKELRPSSQSRRGKSPEDTPASAWNLDMTR